MMNNNLDIYIVCHSPFKILELIEKYKGTWFDNVKFLYVGQYADHKFDDPRIITCLRQIDNIERIPSLLTFTAWYALAKNNLVTSNFVGIFEYDCIFNKNLFELESMLTPNSVIGFVPRTTKETIYLNCIQNFTRFLTKEEIDKSFSIPQWSATTNIIMSKEFLEGFVNWYLTFIPDILVYKNHPHYHERAINVYAANLETELKFAPEYINHLELRSHKIEL